MKFVIEEKIGPKAPWKFMRYSKIYDTREEAQSWMDKLNEHGSGVFRIVEYNLEKHKYRL